MANIEDGVVQDVDVLDPREEQFMPMNHVKKEFFPVEVTDLFDDGGTRVDGWQLVRRSDTGEKLHVHTSSYKLIPFEDNVSAFEDALNKSGLNQDGMRIDSDMSHNGCRHFRQYVLPEYREEIRGKDDNSLRVLMWDSYDGSTRWITRGGFYQWVCANLAVTGEDILSISRKHTQNFDNRVDHQKIIDTVGEYSKQVDLYRKFAGIEIKDVHAKEFFHEMSATRKLAEHLSSQWIQQANDWGKTLWDVYSVLTKYATHGETGKDKANIIAQRQEFVRKIVGSKQFNQLALAA